MNPNPLDTVRVVTELAEATGRDEVRVRQWIKRQDERRPDTERAAFA